MKDYYGLVGEDGSRAPFRVSKLQGTLFYQGYNIIGELTDFYLAELRAIKDELPPLRTDGAAYKWTAIAKGIGQKLEGCENFSLAKFVAVLLSLEAVYGKDCKELRSEKNGAIAAFAQEICDLLKEQPEALAQIRDLMGLSAEWEETETDETVEAAIRSSELIMNIISYGIRDYFFNFQIRLLNYTLHILEMILI